MSKITLTAEMIQSLAAFVAKDGQAAYTLAHGHIPAQAGFAGYSGLIAYSVSDDGGVMALEEVRQKRRCRLHKRPQCCNGRKSVSRLHSRRACGARPLSR
ncbi:hypothetical protein I6P06_004594 [Salmonella enterica]|nr:hypothetical protein [Salmonella enterica]